jgi:hypothetical protein
MVELGLSLNVLSFKHTFGEVHVFQESLHWKEFTGIFFGFLVTPMMEALPGWQILAALILGFLNPLIYSRQPNDFLFHLLFSFSLTNYRS